MLSIIESIEFRILEIINKLRPGREVMFELHFFTNAKCTAPDYLPFES